MGGGSIILEVDGIEFSYKSIKALKNVKFKVKGGEITAILGPNGSGKSTLLKCIARILKPKKGAILIEKNNLLNLDSNEVAKMVGYVPQNSNGNYMTVFDALLLGRNPHIKWNVSEKDVEIVSRVLRLMNLEKYALRYTNQLSGGELQKVIVGRALVQEPKLLLLDEPTSNLDPKNQIEIMKIIRDVSKSQNIASILVMHDLNLALRFSDKFLILRNGEILAEGDKSIITPENLREVYGVEVDIIEYNGLPIVVPKDVSNCSSFERTCVDTPVLNAKKVETTISNC